MKRSLEMGSIVAQRLRNLIKKEFASAPVRAGFPIRHFFKVGEGSGEKQSLANRMLHDSSIRVHAATEQGRAFDPKDHL